MLPLLNGLGFSQAEVGIGNFGHMVLDLESRKVQEKGDKMMSCKAVKKTLEARHVAKESLHA